MALLGNAWIEKNTISEHFSFANMEQFAELWIELQNFNANNDADDEITWNLTTSGQYSAASTYKAQFHGAISTYLKTLVWKVWVSQDQILRLACYSK
jgi:hypothetical protein